MRINNTLQIYNISVIQPNISLIIFIFFSILFEFYIFLSTEKEKEKEVTETINERVNSIIEKEGHTIATFAKKIGVPWTTIKNIVSGRNAPSYDIIVKIINAVDWVDANYLIMGEELTKGNQGNLLTIVERQNKTIESQQKTIDRLTKKMLEN